MPHDETWLKAKISSLLTERGIFFRRIAGGPRGTVGIPDIIGITPNTRRMFAIEVKRPGRYKDCWDGCKRESPTQYKFLCELRDAGGVAICADSLEAATRPILIED